MSGLRCGLRVRPVDGVPVRLTNARVSARATRQRLCSSAPSQVSHLARTVRHRSPGIGRRQCGLRTQERLACLGRALRLPVLGDESVARGAEEADALRTPPFDDESLRQRFIHLAPCGGRLEMIAATMACVVRHRCTDGHERTRQCPDRREAGRAGPKALVSASTAREPDADEGAPCSDWGAGGGGSARHAKGGESLHV